MADTMRTQGKILVIDFCKDCSKSDGHQFYKDIIPNRYQCFCFSLAKKVDSYTIDPDCPLEDAPEPCEHDWVDA